MKILILANNDLGLYRFRKELIKKLVESNVVIACLPNGEFVPNIRALGCKFIECREIERRGKNPFQDIKLAVFYRKLIQRIRPDIALTYTIKPNAYGGIVCSLMGITYIANITGLGASVQGKGLVDRIAMLLYRLGLNNASAVFFQNEENKNYLLKRKAVAEEQVRMIPGSGVNTEEYSYIPYPDENITHFLFIARIMKEKGIDQYLDAAIHFSGKKQKMTFHVCGFCEEEEYQNKLHMLEDKNIIKYHGLVEDMRQMYAMASCVIHPTYYAEGMSNVLLEACACGRPVITTNRVGCREIVDDGVNGFLIKEKDSNDLISKIEMFMNLSKEEKQEMGVKGRNKVINEFDRRIVIDRYLKEIENVKA